MKTIVSFMSPRHAIPNSETPLTPGRELAVELARGLLNEGLAMESTEPMEGEGGWSLWGGFEGVSVSIFLNIAGLGTPIRDHWVVGVQPTGLCWIRPNRKALVAQKACAAIDEVLHQLGCYEVKWWDDVEFERALDGEGAEQ